MTIVSAIQKVLADASTPQTVDQVYSSIVSEGLYTFKAADPKAVVRGGIRRRCVNLDFPTSLPVKLFIEVGKGRYDLASRHAPPPPRAGHELSNDRRLPEEVMDEAYQVHKEELRARLKEAIHAHKSGFFERMVIQLLIRMGYGMGDPNLGLHTGGSNDGGIDGIIKEDKLGLSKIYIQAKGTVPGNTVDIAEVREFAGSLIKVTKGVFITTGRISPRAYRFAEDHEKTISLINGDTLADLMIAHGVGVSEVASYRIMQVDADFFAPAE